MTRYLALGDSYTIGEDVAAERRWPTQLVARLRETGTRIGDADIVATTGWTTGELQDAIDQRTFSPSYDLVSLLIGVNNQYRGLDLEGYRVEYAALLDFAIESANGNAQRVIGVGCHRFGMEACPAEPVAQEVKSFKGIFIGCQVKVYRLPRVTMHGQSGCTDDHRTYTTGAQNIGNGLCNFKSSGYAVCAQWKPSGFL